MIGTVTDEAGTPISGARVSIWLDYVDLASSFTDGAGRYAVQFVGTPGANHVPGYDPPGTEDATAFVNVDAPGYEPYSRYVIGTDEHLVEHVRLRRIWRLQAGESAAVTIDPDDSVCVLDAWPGRELICRTLRVVPSRNALLTVEAVAATPGPSRLELEVHGAVSGAPRTNPTTLPVTAGAEYKVHVEVPWGPAGQSRVVVRTGIVER